MSGPTSSEWSIGTSGRDRSSPRATARSSTEASRACTGCVTVDANRAASAESSLRSAMRPGNARRATGSDTTWANAVTCRSRSWRSDPVSSGGPACWSLTTAAKTISALDDQRRYTAWDHQLLNR